MPDADRPTIIHLVRHGQTDWNALGRFQGCRSDICLNDNGRGQAIALGKAMKDEGKPIPTIVVASPAIRAIVTADLVYSAWAGTEPGAVSIVAEDDLRESDFGEWEGLTYREIVAGNPELHDKWMKTPSDITPPGGESLSQVGDRAWRSVEGICRRWPGKEILLVAHGGSIRSIISKAMDLHPDNARRLNVRHASISTLLFYRDHETGDPCGFRYLDLLNRWV